ncbi:phosphoribosylanthranilate isomerase [Wenyingzhuangia marina]|uniref:N-(5'-phosphoribosyl)anthranilate isomerase n=1 Tax=Wenyingzhuangia marina TaxID=1195760 RepID=A0A1M5SDY4_9FLAO|nr:phosphoribosylanthranilate isomerase [Wenyingzhuangia marina]GGF61686.1 N-(5'-phosphoribosyl)anthranilate isomerase [Wenyingzhuangia marina]SHH36133.1 phosphoribosylanthranilate isomerase [Wenyingzhuangia marina]
MKTKVCGMKYKENIKAVAGLQPDYMGFIFYPKSPRNFEGEIPEIDENIKKTGVFVNAPIGDVVQKVNQYGFKAVQLHGSESVEYCQELNSYDLDIELFKVFSIKDEFDFSVLAAYESFVDYFLFDTKGKDKGGNGYTFDWSVLKNYPSKKPFILSGGIGVEEIEKVKEILKTDLPIYALDINSKFEVEGVEKDVNLLQQFFREIKGVRA